MIGAEVEHWAAGGVGARAPASLGSAVVGSVGRLLRRVIITARRVIGAGARVLAQRDIIRMRQVWQAAECVGISRRGVVNEESHRKVVASHPDTESCMASRKAAIEALTGAMQAGYLAAR
jgi:hypothetical protein